MDNLIFYDKMSVGIKSNKERKEVAITYVFKKVFS